MSFDINVNDIKKSAAIFKKIGNVIQFIENNVKFRSEDNPETAKALNLELNEIRILIENSFKSSFLDEKIKNEWLKKIN